MGTLCYPCSSEDCENHGMSLVMGAMIPRQHQCPVPLVLFNAGLALWQYGNISFLPFCTSGCVLCSVTLIWALYKYATIARTANVAFSCHSWWSPRRISMSTEGSFNLRSIHRHLRHVPETRLLNRGYFWEHVCRWGLLLSFHLRE